VSDFYRLYNQSLKNTIKTRSSKNMSSTIFHLAFPVADIPKAKAFYVKGLGCHVGRELPSAVILNLYGHQLVAHVTDEVLAPQIGIYPRHFGLIFPELNDWEILLDRAKRQQLKFHTQPVTRFTDNPIEHKTFFLEDPFYNLLEFKFYTHPEAIFGDRQFQLIGDRD
jgi:uncharacterized protein